MNLSRLAHGISWVFHPFLLPLYFLLLLLTCTTFSLYPTSLKLYFLWVVLLYTMGIPVLALIVLRKMGMLSSYRIDQRQERIIPLIVGAVCYLLCAVTLAQIPSAVVIRKFMFAAAACEIVCLVVSSQWKISLHLTGMGALVALIALLGVVGMGQMMLPLVVAILGAGLLASARLYLGCHTPIQILVGFLNGFFVSLFVVLFF